MGIVLASNFDVKTNLALDSRTNKNTIEERNEIPAEVRFEGLECYVKEDGGLYRLTGGVENSNWSLIPYTDADGNLTIDGNLILNNSSTPINIKEYIDTLTAAGIHYIGTLDGTESSPGSFTPAAEVGDMYIVSTAGYINGVEVEVGDSILCHTDTEAADSGTYTSINSNWNYVQANISTMRGATSDTPGMSGIVPIPSAGSENKYLKGDGTWSSIAQSDVTDLVNDLESKADKQNSNGGFEAGSNASATYGGGAVGSGASTDSGGAVGHGANAASTGGAVGSGASTFSGGAVGYDASVFTGGAVGNSASATIGGAVGASASANNGGAVGSNASAISGGAVGSNAKTSTGFAGGANAKTVDGENNGIDAIQLGTGTNSTAKTLQVYDYQLMTADGNIPSDRLKNSNGGFAAGNSASATFGGGAVGYKASATDGGGAVGSSAKETTGGFAGGNSASATEGGAVGYNAKSGSGFAGGANAKAVDGENNGIDAIQLGTGTNSTAKTLQVYDYQLMDSTGNIPLDRIQSALDESGISGGQETAHTHANKDVLDGISSTDITNWNNKADKQTPDGGFVGGDSASATTGGAVGSGATTKTGFAGGLNATEGDEEHGYSGGAAVGQNTFAISGGAVGLNASANTGGAIGMGASVSSGGAIGQDAKTGDGFAGGVNAKTVDAEDNGIDAIQLGIGTNSTAKTLQVYKYQLMDADGYIPSDRLKNSYGGFAAGNDASAISGGSVGSGASAQYGGAVGFAASVTSGGAIGQGAKTGNGFAGGYNAKTVDGENNGIDAIQLGTGTNSTAKTLQVYDYQLMTAYGNIPSDRLKNLDGGFAAGNGASASTGGAVGMDASVTSGGAIGQGSFTSIGGAVGSSATSGSGGAIGGGSSANNGGAVGYGARTSSGFAGGYNAKTNDGNTEIDAIQLGTGTNSTAKTLQVYDYQLMGADGYIPKERLDIPYSIDGINLDSAVEDMVHFAYCSTSGSTAAKTVTVNGFTKIDGSKVAIYFANNHTASSITLNVNNTGASSIKAKVGSSTVTIPGRGLVSGRIYYFIYYYGYYYLLNPNIIDGYDIIYGPSTNNSNFKWLISFISSGKPSFSSDKILLSPGLYSFSAAGYLLLGSNIYVKGYTSVNKDIASQSNAATSTEYSVIDCDTGSSTGISQYKYNNLNYTALFENIIFNYMTVNGVISNDSELFDFGNYNCKVKFKNCQFNFNTYRLISINSGSLEFENCSFYTVAGGYNVACSRIVNQRSDMSYPLNVSFKNCKIDFVRDADYLMTLYGSSNYETNLIVKNCDISAGGIYESRGSFSNYIRNISILNNNINPIYETGNSTYIYSDGNFIFSGNTVTGHDLDNINLNISSRRSIVTNNVFSKSVNVNYRQNGINQNIFSHNILCGECTLNGAGKYSSSQTANSNITAIGNSGFNPIETSGFGTVHQAYNNYNA